MFSLFKNDIDWLLVAAVFPLVAAGLVTMHSFVGESSFFEKQIVFAGIGFLVLAGLSFIDFRFLRRTGVLMWIFFLSCGLLLFLFVAGDIVQGSQRWLDLGSFSVQPSDPAKLVLVLILAKYFSRRHVEIAHVRHILISGFYTLVLFLLVFLQPDLGSAIIIFLIWLGMVLVSGISKKHLAIVGLTGVLSLLLLWSFVLEEYQKERIRSFIHPLTDIQGAGYNAYQSTVAVGSGELLGKGVGFGTQSRLKFLPEYETDFIFAAFAEEWGFVGVLLLFMFFGAVIWRILVTAARGAGNFEVLFGVGLAIIFMSHFIIHVGMNIGLLPVTGTPLPFVSYGGSHLLTEFIGLGILLGMRRYARTTHQGILQKASSAIEGVAQP